MTAVRLEPMTTAEFPAWLRHSRDGFAAQQVASGVLPPGDAERYADEQLTKLLPDGLATPHQHLWTVRPADGDDFLGHLWVEVRDDADGPGAYVYDVELVPQARGRGLGAATMRAAEEAAAELGAQRVRLNVFGHNTVARRLYDRLGYEVASTFMTKRLVPGDAFADGAAGPHVELHDIAPERYRRFRVEQEASYAANIARSGAFGERQARAKAEDDFNRLLPEGPATPGHRIWTGHGPDGDEVGLLWVHLTERADGLDAFGYDFVVREDLRRHGWGRALMRSAERVLAGLGVTSVGLSVFGFNAGARSLYEQEGFDVGAESRVKLL